MASDDTVTALVLDESVVAHGEPVHFGGFPGVWAAEHPVAVRELGFDTDEDALDRVRELGLPLTETTVPADGGKPLPVPNHMPGADEVRGTDWKPQPGEPGAQLQPGETFPPSLGPVTVAEVAEELASPLDVNVEPALEVVAATPADELDALELAEQSGRDRTTVLQAIAARREELAAATPVDEGEGE